MKPNRLLFVVLFLFGSVHGAVAAGPEDSVVCVFASLRLPNPTRPWAKQNPVQVMGTGVVIDGKTVLTNAHVVGYASEVFIQDRRGGDRVPAKVTSMGPGIDLATLVPEDPSFCEKRPGIARAAKRAAAGDSVVLMGFSTNSAGLMVSRGVVSRIDHAPYADLTDGILIRVDAPPMPGNSGGPASSTGRWSGWSSDGPRMLGLSSPMRRSIPISPTSTTDGTTASPGSTTTSRRWLTRPCGRSSGSRDRTAVCWSVSLASSIRPIPSVKVTL